MLHQGPGRGSIVPGFFLVVFGGDGFFLTKFGLMKLLQAQFLIVIGFGMYLMVSEVLGLGLTGLKDLLGLGGNKQPLPHHKLKQLSIPFS